ncbi:unnamed protein product [Caenorhabditis brenneri]
MDQSNIHPKNNQIALPISNISNLAKATVGKVLNSAPRVPNDAWAPTIMHNFIIQAQQAMLAENQQKLAQAEDALMRKSAETYRKQMENEVEKLRLNSINAANVLDIESLKSKLAKMETDLQQANQVSTNVSSTLESLVSTFSQFVTSKIEQQNQKIVHMVNSIVEQHKVCQFRILSKVVEDQKTLTEEVIKRFEFQTNAVEDMKRNLLNSVEEAIEAVLKKSNLETKKATSITEPLSDRSFRKTPFQVENFQQVEPSHKLENGLRPAKNMDSQVLEKNRELLSALRKVQKELDEARERLLSYENQHFSIQYISRAVGCGTQFLEPPSKIRKIN